MRIGDKNAPACRRCEHMGSRCVYPTERKRISLETQFKTLRRKIETPSQREEICKIGRRLMTWGRVICINSHHAASLLDHVDADLLKAALRRRNENPQPWPESPTSSAELPAIADLTADPIADPIAEPTESFPGPNVRPAVTSPIEEPTVPLEDGWLENMVTGSWSDNPGMGSFFDIGQMCGASLLQRRSAFPH